MTQILDPLQATTDIADRYRRYLRSTFLPRDADLAAEFDRALAEHALTRGPYLEASAPFEPGATVRELVDQGVLSRHFLRFEPDVFPIDRSLHRHQEQAIRKAVTERRNLVVSTGTGSGKTEAFLVPIIDSLFREIDDGTISDPGVRALLLYPMNALANDQVKRLRRLLAPFPELTFGRYVGDTTHSKRDAEDVFRDRYPNEPRVANELLSRDVMQKEPPRILLTNYAMLEFLLLRPADSSFFDGPTARHWRTVVLDEAHVYDGAQGTEVAMLLRRVRDRVLESQRGRLQCFATSATLGRGAQDYPRLITFAQRLFDEHFEWDPSSPEHQDIVVATRKPLATTDGAYRLPQPVYRQLQDCYRTQGGTPTQLHELVAIVAGTPAPQADEGSPAYLGRLLASDSRVIEVQALLEEGAHELADLASRVMEGDSAAADLVALIDLCVAARRRDEDAALIPARYHFWVNSLEGGFLCLHDRHPADQPRLSLTRRKTCDPCAEAGITSTTAELAVCRSCGSGYLVGELQREALKPVGDLRSPSTYLLLNDEVSDDDDAEVETGATWRYQGQVRTIDPATGALATSGSGRSVVEVIRPNPTEPLHRCPSCGSSTAGEVVFRLQTGTDAPVAVVASELYQAVPPSADPKLAAAVGEGRKLLSFADSRQDAAYFAPYLERTYTRSVARRLIHREIVALHEPGEPPRTEDIITRVRRAAENHLLLDPDASRQTNTRIVGEWVTYELAAMDRRQSLEGLGLADIRVARPRAAVVPSTLTALGFTEHEALDVLQLLLDTIRIQGAITMPEDVDVRRVFEPRERAIAVREEGSEYGVIGWCHSGSSTNRRVDLLRKLFARRGIDEDPAESLRSIWIELTDRDSGWDKTLSRIQDKQGVRWQIGSDWLEIELASAQHASRRCDTCRRVWFRTVNEVCPGWRCEGSVATPVTAADHQANHYAALYQQLAPIGMSVQEHTAQWRSEQASAIQDNFTRGDINVLSCSTTFELGVDVGEVQAVLLRNVPPRAANYVQRAGRAGRRQDSAALVVTYAQRRAHDKQYFANPGPMINGQVDPPLIMLDNEPILRRHAHSVAFAAFERERVDRGDAEHRTVEDFFSPADNRPDGVGEMRAWLDSHPRSVGEALTRVLPGPISTAIGVETWAWVGALYDEDELVSSHGWLGRAISEVDGDLNGLDERITATVESEDYGFANRLKWMRKTLSSRHLLSFLASRNVLPKYGFPVDVVELDLRGSGDPIAERLELSRDLRTAISTYAPQAEVVAGKVVWRSRGLKNRRDRQLPQYGFKVCKECGAFRFAIGEAPGACKECGSSEVAFGSGRYVHPIFGFIGDRQGEPGESRPLRQTLTETWFGSYGEAVPEFQRVSGLAGPHVVEHRTSPQGRIVTVNRGPGGRGFRYCNWCGYAEPAPSQTAGTGRKRREPKPHQDLRRPQRKCEGTMSQTNLGHDFLTDVTEIRIDGLLGRRYGPAVMRSLLYALLAAVPDLGITRDDVDGTLHPHSPEASEALIIFDAVPGGAGHARFIAENLVTLMHAALERVRNCTCDPAGACYSCLLSFSNQRHHEVLSRGDAAAVLTLLLQQNDSTLELFSSVVHHLVGAAIAAGASVPVPDHQAGSPENDWHIEAAWPDRKVGIVLDSNPERDDWLQENGWTIRHVHDWILVDLLRALGLS